MDITGVGSYTGSDAYSAQRVQATQRSAGDLEGMIQRLIQAKAGDDSGSLSAAEICISDEAFKRIDTNQDGELDRKELTDSVKQIGHEKSRPPHVRGLRSDDDGHEDDEEEENARLRALLDLLSQNGDEATQTSIDAIF